MYHLLNAPPLYYAAMSFMDSKSVSLTWMAASLATQYTPKRAGAMWTRSMTTKSLWNDKDAFGVQMQLKNQKGSSVIRRVMKERTAMAYATVSLANTIEHDTAHLSQAKLIFAQLPYTSILDMSTSFLLGAFFPWLYSDLRP
ncbi:hypothetical protein ANO11243_050740 [Dothideomycetidae sp. 11243]|nr:hypothetical protein ANO11243_050740 [fungal sp. No.11243]